MFQRFSKEFCNTIVTSLESRAQALSIGTLVRNSCNRGSLGTVDKGLYGIPLVGRGGALKQTTRNDSKLACMVMHDVHYV